MSNPEDCPVSNSLRVTATYTGPSAYFFSIFLTVSSIGLLKPVIDRVRPTGYVAVRPEGGGSGCDGGVSHPWPERLSLATIVAQTTFVWFLLNQ